MPMFNAADWYWRVANDPSKIYSSKRNLYVGPMDADYVAWLVAQGVPAAVPIASEGEVWDYVKGMHPAWVLDPSTGSFAYPGQNLYSKGQLKNYSFEKRVLAENSGMNSATVGGRVRTDEHAKTLIMMAASQADGDPGYMTRSISPDGLAQLNATQVLAVEGELATFVEGVFNTYAQLDADITGGTVTQLSEIDAAYAAVAPPPP